MKSCTKREMLSLIGQLQHASCLVKPGQSFLCRMIELSKVAKELNHKIRLNKGFRSDLQWWACFLPSWNGDSMMSSVVKGGWKVTVTSDVPGSWGCGAFTSSGEWFQLQLLESWSSIHITVKELLPIVLGAVVWGEKWEGKTVRCLCDNAAVVAIIKSGRSKVERAMHLIRSLFFFLAKFGVVLVGEHIPGIENGAADALSRDNLPSFRLQLPGVQPQPTAIPRGDLDRLAHHYFVKGLANSTHKAYQSAQKRYLTFCGVARERAVPAAESTLCKFASSLAREKLKHRTIKSYLSGVRYLHIAEEGDPS